MYCPECQRYSNKNKGLLSKDLHSIRKKFKIVKPTNVVFYMSESASLFRFINEWQKTQRSRILASIKSEVRQPQKGSLAGSVILLCSQVSIAEVASWSKIAASSLTITSAFTSEARKEEAEKVHTLPYKFISLKLLVPLL